jgi:hypothetical protein
VKSNKSRTLKLRLEIPYKFFKQSTLVLIITRKRTYNAINKRKRINIINLGRRNSCPMQELAVLNGMIIKGLINHQCCSKYKTMTRESGSKSHSVEVHIKRITHFADKRIFISFCNGGSLMLPLLVISHKSGRT